MQTVPDFASIPLYLPKRCQRLHCNGPFGATYDSTDTRKPQSSVTDCTFDTPGPRATDKMKCRWDRGLGGVLVVTAGSQLHDSLDTNVQGFEIVLDDNLRHASIHILHQ